MTTSAFRRPVKRTWWVLPYFGGVLAVIVAAAAVTAVLHTPRMGHGAARPPPRSSPGPGGDARARADVPGRPVRQADRLPAGRRQGRVPRPGLGRGPARDAGLVGQPEGDRLHHRGGHPDRQPRRGARRPPRQRQRGRAGRGAQPARPGRQQGQAGRPADPVPDRPALRPARRDRADHLLAVARPRPLGPGHPLRPQGHACRGGGPAATARWWTRPCRSPRPPRTTTSAWSTTSTSRTWTSSRASWCSSRPAPRPGTAGSSR